MLLAPQGKASDILGRRGAALVAIGLFTAGTFLCGVAPSMELLIVGRLVAGMGGGGMMAISSSKHGARLHVPPSGC